MPTVVWQSKTPIRKFRIFHVIMSITCVNLVFFLDEQKYILGKYKFLCGIAIFQVKTGK